MQARLPAIALPLGGTAEPEPAQAAAAARSLTRTTMVGWGIGTLGPVIVLSATNALLLRFITDFVGLSAALAATLIGLSKLYDAFADPAMGWLSDRTRSRWGRRRPYLLAGGALLALSVFALFWVPGPDVLGSETARTLYVGAALMFYATAYTVFNIPYMAMPAEMASAYHQRTALMSWRVVAVGLAQIIAMFLGAAMVDWFGGGARGHLGMASVLAPIVLASAVVCFVMTRAAPYTEATTTHAPFSVQARSVLENRPYLVLIAVKLLTLTALSAQSVFPYFFQRILGVSNVYLGTYFAVASVALIASQPVWIRASKRLGKSLCYRIALGASIPVSLSWLLAGAGDPLWSILARGAAIGFAGGGALLMGQSLLPDTMEYDHLRTGLRREGIFAGFYTTVEKVAGALGIAAVGAILSGAGYLQSRGVDVVQPESALTAIRLVIALLPSGVSLAALLLLFGYTLSEERLQALRQQART